MWVDSVFPFSLLPTGLVERKLLQTCSTQAPFASGEWAHTSCDPAPELGESKRGNI